MYNRNITRISSFNMDEKNLWLSCKSYCSLTVWSIYCSVPDSQVRCIALCGPNVHVASVVIKDDVSDQKQIEKELFKLKASNPCNRSLHLSNTPLRRLPLTVTTRMGIILPMDSKWRPLIRIHTILWWFPLHPPWAPNTSPSGTITQQTTIPHHSPTCQCPACRRWRQ